MLEDQAPNLLVAFVAIGMGVSFLAADPETPTSRALALFFGLFGIAVTAHSLQRLGVFPGHTIAWSRAHAIFEGAALAAGFEWLLRVGRTKKLSDPIARSGESLLRGAQLLAVVFVVLGLVFAGIRAETLDVDWTSANLRRPGFYLLVAPFYLSMALGGMRIAQLLRLELDHSEKVRLGAFTAATPFFASIMVVPSVAGTFLVVVGLMIFLAGAVRYHVLQGQRAHFLARFLSPQVARLVHERGLSGTMQQNRVHLSVVACDLRGFTAFAETAAPEDVIQFLRDYYQALGDTVTGYGGTIKDFAGDGILTLVGAPIPFPDHARRAVGMAVAIRERVGVVLERWRRLGLELGLGIGVASGFVTVGTIDGAGRLEYMAIGPAVNLAARLCDHAASGQILVDPRTVGLVEGEGGEWTFETLDTVDFKGFSKPIAVAAVVAGAEPERAARVS